jgi:hypothetical protein
LDYAIAQVKANGTKYDQGKRDQVWAWADCSSLVWHAFKGIGAAESIGFTGWTKSVVGQVDHFKSGNWSKGQLIWTRSLGGDTTSQTDAIRRGQVRVGDLFYRYNGQHSHVAFFAGFGADRVSLFHAQSPSGGVGMRDYPIHSVIKTGDYTHCVRPVTMGNTMAINNYTTGAGHSLTVRAI